MAKYKEASPENVLEGSLQFSWKTAQVRVWTERTGYMASGERGCQETHVDHLLPGNGCGPFLISLPHSPQASTGSGSEAECTLLLLEQSWKGAAKLKQEQLRVPG